MKTATQIKALVRNRAKAKNVEAETILRSFMMERFLERVSVSDYKDNFILKGGMLIAAIVGIETRTTMDVDATIKGNALSQAEAATFVENVLNVSVDDGVSFAVRSIEEIRDDVDYPGFRISIEAVLEKTRQMLKVDITAGDFVTPRETEYRLPLMFEDRTISIMAYNLETILAEKLEAIISRGATTTRMRDFYDIYILTTTQVFDEATFYAALKKTAEKRGTILQMANLQSVIQVIEENSLLKDHWQRYKKRFAYASNVSWEMTIEALRKLSQNLPEFPT
ncbi:MAG: nucleotidyl transferase AbiEii/AbiGii toxin family protein [Eggerthellaceae bacterium]|nr:nucleotidyl transferase AbiEii/AbiGii toxin family protein [Eggerthellaceae bacterium]